MFWTHAAPVLYDDAFEYAASQLSHSARQSGRRLVVECVDAYGLGLE